MTFSSQAPIIFDVSSSAFCTVVLPEAGNNGRVGTVLSAAGAEFSVPNVQVKTSRLAIQYVPRK